MLIPSERPLFENVSSREYYSRVNELKDKALDGCLHIVFPDFEEAILFSGGQAVAAVYQSRRWLAVGDELLEPAENKALATDGRMAAYELTAWVLDIFVHKQLQAMVESELGPYLMAGPLVRYLEGDKSTCVLKLEDGRSTAYVFINFGKLAGAAYESPEGRLYGDGAIKALDSFKEHARMAIYFTEPSPKYLKSKAKARAEGHAAKKPIMPWPAKAIETVAPPKPVEPPVSPFPVEAARPLKKEQSIRQAPAKPAHTPPPIVSGVKLVVAMSEDRELGLRHRSRQQTLEALEEGDVAWVDGKTFTLLHLLDPNVNIILPDGREYAVTLVEAPILPRESRYIIMPRKLRKRLSVDRGSTIEIKA